MIKRILLLYLPAGLLASYLAGFAAFCAFPLTSLGARFGYQPDYSRGYSNHTIWMAMLFYYVITVALLGFVPRLAFGYRVLAGLLAAGLMCLLGIAWGMSGLSGHRSDPPALFLPVEALQRFAVTATAPARMRHYVLRLRSPSGDLRWRAVSSLHLKTRDDKRSMSPSLKTALAEAFRDERESPVRDELCLALEDSELRDPSDVACLVSGLRAGDPAWRLQTVKLLGHLRDAPPQGDDSDLVAPLLDVLRTDPDHDVRAAAAASLYALDGSGSRCIPALEEALRRGEIFAADLLDRIDDESPRVREAALQGLRSSDPDLRIAWLQAVPDLHCLANAPSGTVREVLRELEGAERDAHREVRRAAMQARNHYLPDQPAAAQQEPLLHHIALWLGRSPDGDPDLRSDQLWDACDLLDELDMELAVDESGRLRHAILAKALGMIRDREEEHDSARDAIVDRFDGLAIGAAEAAAARRLLAASSIHVRRAGASVLAYADRRRLGGDPLGDADVQRRLLQALQEWRSSNPDALRYDSRDPLRDALTACPRLTPQAKALLDEITGDTPDS